jgi:hypothetical protein
MAEARDVLICQIAPLTSAYRCRPDAVRRYVIMLREGRKAPPIWLERLPRGSSYRYRVFDGAHRLRAAKRLGRTTMEAVIITSRH